MANALATQLHPAVMRILRLAAATHPVAAARAARVLEHVLGPVAEEGAWSESDLTRPGLPLEVSFTTADVASLRLTVEAASPRLDPKERLRCTVSMYEELASPLPRDVRQMIEVLEPVSFGAWLGIRCDAARTTWKLYVEGAETSSPFPRLPVAARLTMTAYDGASDRIESYFRAEALGISGLHMLARELGLASEAEGLLAFLEEAFGRPFHGALPSCDLGFSLSVPCGSGADVRLTLYGFAGSLFGGDGQCRAAILRVLAAHRWRVPLYELITSPLCDRRGLAMHHGMFGVSVAAGAPPSISFGIAPPEDAS